MAGLLLGSVLSSGVSADVSVKVLPPKAPEKILCDGQTWTLASGDFNYVTSVCGDINHPQRDDIELIFGAIWVSKKAPQGPYGWHYYVNTPEITNTLNSTYPVKLHIKFGPFPGRDVMAKISGGNADITNENNPQSTIDWIHKNLTSTSSDIAAVMITVPVRELGAKIRGGQVIRNDNLTDKIYTFGLRNSKRTVEQAQKNWP